MSSVIQEPPTDVVIVGLGVAGGIVATELAVNGTKVVGIDKGFYYDYATDWALDKKGDEWYTLFHPTDHSLSLWSPATLRHNSSQVALPLRRYVSGVNWVMGNGVGGAAVHYGAGFGRFGPWPFEAVSETASKYGANFLTSIEPNVDMEDWPISYTDAIPYYNTFEQAWGVTGTNQDPFTPNATYPVPPHPFTPTANAFQTAAEALGYHPHPGVTAILSKPYVNQYGLAGNACVYDGFCSGGEGCTYNCETGAKRSTHVSHIPAAVASGNLTMTLNSIVSRIEVDSATGMATGVTYQDATGQMHFQPASVVYSAAYLVNNARLFFLSGIGQPYNQVTATGSLGRNFVEASPGGTTSVSGTFNVGGNAYSAGNGAGGSYTMEDFADDNFDHTGQNFIGGTTHSFGGYLGAAPHTFTGITPNGNNIGSAYKASLKNLKLPTKQTLAVGGAGPNLPTTQTYTSLDPHFSDIFGDPLLRVTSDYGINGWNAANYIAPTVGPGLLQKMGCTNITTNKGTPLSTHPHGTNIHWRGGMRMGSNSSSTVVNQWLQSWTIPNLFACSESADTFGDTTTAGTHIVGMMSYITADGIQSYLKSPGPLA